MRTRKPKFKSFFGHGLFYLALFLSDKLVPKKVRLDQLFWPSGPIEYEGTACAQIRGLSAQSPTDLTRLSGTPGAQAHAYDV